MHGSLDGLHRNLGSHANSVIHTHHDSRTHLQPARSCFPPRCRIQLLLLHTAVPRIEHHFGINSVKPNSRAHNKTGRGERELPWDSERFGGRTSIDGRQRGMCVLQGQTLRDWNLPTTVDAGRVWSERDSCSCTEMWSPLTHDHRAVTTASQRPKHCRLRHLPARQRT